MPHHLVGKTFPRYRRKLIVSEFLDGAWVVRTWIYAASGMGLARLLSYVSFAATCMFGLLATRKADILFIESPPLFLAIPGIFVAKTRGMQVIFNVADLWPDSVRALGGPFANRVLLRCAESLERWAYHSSDLVCAVSEGIVRTLTTTKRLSKRKVLFFPNGVDTELFSERQASTVLARKYGSEAARIFLYAGTHGAAQGLETVIEAAALLRDSPAFFLFLGDGHTKPKLRALAVRLALHNVAFVDSQPLAAVPDYFSISYASIVPLIKRDMFKDARPSKIFPSLASGVPVIYSGEGEAARLLISNGAGVVVEPQCPRALADAIRNLIEHPELRNEMGRQGRRLAERVFAWDTIVATWLREVRDRLNV